MKTIIIELLLPLILVCQALSLHVQMQIEEHLWEQNKMMLMDEGTPEEELFSLDQFVGDSCDASFDSCVASCADIYSDPGDEVLFRYCLDDCRDDFRECVKDERDESMYIPASVQRNAQHPDSFIKDEHWCMRFYENPEVQSLCVSLDLHSEESAKHWSALYSAWRQSVQQAPTIRGRTQ